MASFNATSVPALARLANVAEDPTPLFELLLGPVTLLGAVHAVRVSHAVRQIYRAQGPRVEGKINWLQSTALVLLLLYAGTTLLALLVAEPAPFLLDPVGPLLYAGVHLLLHITGLGSLMLSLPQLPLDLFFILVDGFLRTGGIALLGVDYVRALNDDRLNSSVTTMVVAGTLVGGGAPLVVGTFDLFEADWRLRTPTWILAPSGLAAVDVWSSALVSLLYATLTSAHPCLRVSASARHAFESRWLAPFLPAATRTAHAARLADLKATGLSGAGNSASSWLEWLRARPAAMPADDVERWLSSPVLPAKEARALCAVVLILILVVARLAPELPGLFNSIFFSSSSGGGGKKRTAMSERKRFPTAPRESPRARNKVKTQ